MSLKVWAKQMGGSNANASGNSIAVGASGNVYTTGYFSGTVDFDPGAGVYNLTPGGDFDIFVSKLDAAGNFVWAKQMGGTGFDGALSIAVDASENVYTTGAFFGTVDFDPGPGVFNLGAAANENIFVSKLDAVGNFVWAKQMFGLGVSAGGYGVSIAVDASENVYTTGSFNGTVDFDPGPGIFNLSSGMIDIFVSKLDAAGNFVWAKQMGGFNANAYGYSIAVDASGNVYTTGSFTDIVDFDPGMGVFNFSSSGSEDIFVSKLDAAGNFVWAKQIGGTEGDVGNSVAIDASGNVYTTGWFSDIVDFDPGMGVYYLTSIGTPDIFVHKMGPCANSSSTINAAICPGQNYSGYSVSGIYIDTLVAANGCDSILTINLTVKPTSSSTITQSICQGKTYSGHSASGTYIDTLVAANGCDNIVTLQLTVLPKPTADLGADKDLCSGDSIVLYPGQFDNYLWQDGTIQSSITIKQPGLYYVVVTNKCGTSRDEILIKERICDIYFPSAFTPNNDGKNDLFKILGAHNLGDFHLEVYNRWGQKVFETTNYTKGWSGNFKGQLQDSGIYVWYCHFKKSSTSGSITMKGTVVLIR